MEACRQAQEYNNLLDHYMPQRPTTHKDLHRAVIGSVLTLAYLLVIQDVGAQNASRAASAELSTKSAPAKLVKNEPAKPSAAGPAKAVVPAKLKPLSPPTAAIAVPEVKSPLTKGGKLREIPLSSLDGDKILSTPKAVKEAKPDGNSAAKTKGTADRQTEAAPAKKAGGEPDKITAPTKKKDDTPAKKTATVKSKRSTAPVPRLNNGLVPPPPPIVPIGMDVLGMYAQPVDYLSLKDLEARKKELSVRFNELDSIVSDGQRQIKERKERAELFESLYQEGVVSRKELEVAKREAGEIDRDFKFKQDELDSVKISMKAVNNRLAVLKKMEAKMHPGKQKQKKAVAAGKVKSTESKR